ncbi:Asp23/Gls24 family envelope stress response protein [Streptomyces corynorhini]|uniref:Asp23/Gls24 family envelope stress response protein n=1 Tax=Streptomyces corynorhini TaxID=2282652 RepID=A0A370B561_9ACTN|nr:Asp23/Gls24 family envelope stress response protein [Streptomyces corynorhini]RDG34525.1 Asp23/Gls24 family envelope stress response protein [Streptomyces corynorhini]
MTTTSTATEALPQAAPAAPPAAPGSAERGVTTIAERVVERIAAHAVTEVDGVGGVGRRVLGVAVGAGEPDRDATVSARIKGATTSLDVRLSVSYPVSVARTTEAARAHLKERVGEFTGLTVSRVDITVTALHSAVADTRRVL